MRPRSGPPPVGEPPPGAPPTPDALPGAALPDGPLPGTPAPGGSPDEPARPLTPFQAEVVELVDGLQPGEVVTYAEVAQEIGRPGSGQAVANVLRRVPGLPWWRVIPSTARLYRTHAPTQAPLLRADGVSVDADGNVRPPRDRVGREQRGGRRAPGPGNRPRPRSARFSG